MSGLFSNPTEGSSEQTAGVYLPPELISDIFSRFPVKSVGRFRCVCKQWRTLFSDRKFLKLQFSRNKSENKFITMHMTEGSSSFLTIDFFEGSNYCTRSNIVAAMGKSLNFQFSDHQADYLIHGSCNGLVLLADHNKDDDLDLVIANPITHESRQLSELPAVPTSSFCENRHNFYALGYDSIADDYKVVLLRSDQTCFVYSLKGNIWKEVQNSPSNCYTAGGFVNAANHWNAYLIPLRRNCRTIFAFDFTDETFCKVEGAGVGLKELDDVCGRGVIGGSPCLVNGYGQQCSEVWVMMRESWTKYLVPPLVRIDRTWPNPWFLWNDYEFLAKMHTGKHVLFNLKSATSREIEIQGEGIPQAFFDHHLYVHSFAKSLFSPNQ